MAITRLSGGNTPADGADPRTFPAIWNGTADDLEAGDYDLDVFPVTGVASRWIAPFGPISSVLGVEGRSIACPVYIGRSVNVVRLASIATVAGSAGAVIRLGVSRFDDDGGGLTLIVDGGTIDGTLTTQQEVTVSVTLTRGLYLPVAFNQGLPATQPTMRTKGQVAFGAANSNAPSNFLATTNGFLIDGVAGALPSTLAYPVVGGFPLFVSFRIN